jgi:hypothetical protein
METFHLVIHHAGALERSAGPSLADLYRSVIYVSNLWDNSKEGIKARDEDIALPVSMDMVVHMFLTGSFEKMRSLFCPKRMNWVNQIIGTQSLQLHAVSTTI